MLKRVRGLFRGWAVLWAGGGMLVAVLVVALSGRWRFEATAVVAFTPGPQVVASGFFTDECDLLTGRNVLANALSRTGRSWSSEKERDDAIVALRELVSTVRVNDDKRTLVTLRVVQGTSDGARELAWAILRAFDAYRSESLDSEEHAGLAELRKQVADQERAVEDARRKLLKVAKSLPPEATLQAPGTHDPPKPPMNQEELERAGRALAEQNAPSSPRISLVQAPESSWLPVSPRPWTVLTVGGLGGLGLLSLVSRFRIRQPL